MFNKDAQDAPSRGADESLYQHTSAAAGEAPDRLTQLANWRTQVIWRLLGLAVATGVGAVASMGLVIWQFIAWRGVLPPNAQPTLEMLVKDRPLILVTAVAGGGFGMLLFVVGLATWRKLFGPEDKPPRQVFWLFTSLPLMLTLLGGVMTIPKGGVVTVLCMPVMLGYGLALVPLEIGALAIGLIQMGLRQLREQPQAIAADELPAKVAAYFDHHEIEALEANLMPLGDFGFQPHSNRYRRCWMAPNGAYFVDVVSASAANTTLQAMGVFSATSDGHYFETVDKRFDRPVQKQGEQLAHVEMVEGAPLAELIETHIARVAAWSRESGCRPLEFHADDLNALCRYGIAALMRETNNPLLWLGNVHAGQPLPPLPGQPWQPEEEPSRLV